MQTNSKVTYQTIINCRISVCVQELEGEKKLFMTKRNMNNKEMINFHSLDSLYRQVLNCLACTACAVPAYTLANMVYVPPSSKAVFSAAGAN